ncbi:MAG: hypothetical protein Q9160_003324 [Pyrenula sp. 1 TL-2023]
MERRPPQHEPVPKLLFPPNGEPHAILCTDKDCKIADIVRQMYRLAGGLNVLRTPCQPLGLPGVVSAQIFSMAEDLIGTHSHLYAFYEPNTTFSDENSVHARAYGEALLALEKLEAEANDTRSTTMSAQDELTAEDQEGNEDGSEEEASNDDGSESNERRGNVEEANTEHETDGNDEESGIEDTEDDNNNSSDDITILPQPEAPQSDSDATETAPSSWFEGAEEIASRDGSCSTDDGCKQDALRLRPNLLEQILPKPKMTRAGFMASHVKRPWTRICVPIIEPAEETDHDGSEVDSDDEEASDVQANDDTEQESKDMSAEDTDCETSSGSARDSVMEVRESEALRENATSETSNESEGHSTKDHNGNTKAKDDPETDGDFSSTESIGSIKHDQDRTLKNDIGSPISTSSESSCSEESDGHSWAGLPETDTERTPTWIRDTPMFKPASLDNTPRHAFKRKVVAAAEDLCRTPKRQKQNYEEPNKGDVIHSRFLKFREKYILKAEKRRLIREARKVRKARGSRLMKA